MKTSVLKSALLKKRASMEQGDISIVVNQDGKETDGVDPAASMPPELTDPTASIADQPEVDEAVAPATTDDAATLDEGDIGGQIAQDDAGVQEGEDALEAMESYLGTIRRLRAERMPVSQASIEALNVGIDAALGRWNITAREIGIMPSHESFAANPMASLESMEKELVASMEGIADKINDFVRENISRVADVVVGMQRSAAKQKARLEAVVKSAQAATKFDGFEDITNKKIISEVELIIQNGTNSAAVAGKIGDINASIIDFFNSRSDQIRAAAVKALEAIKVSGGDPRKEKSIVETFRADVTKLVTADNRETSFMFTISPAQWTLLLGGFAAGGAGAALTAVAGVGAGTVSILGGIIRSITSQATHVTPSTMRDKKPGSAVLSKIMVLEPKDAITAAQSTAAMLDAVAKYAIDKTANAKKLQGIVTSVLSDQSFKEEGEDYVKKNPDYVEETGGDGDNAAMNISDSVKLVRTFVRDTYMIETAMVRAIRQSSVGLVDYLVEGAKQYTPKGVKAEAPAEPVAKE